MQEKENDKKNMMMRIASMIVNQRVIISLVFAAACIYCIISIPKVKIVQSLTDYLPETTETRIGLDLMEEEFLTFGTAKIMIANVTYDQAQKLAGELEEIEGISAVSFYDWDEADTTYKDNDITDYYKDTNALLTLTFDEEEDTDLSQKAIAQVRQYLDGYESYVYTTVDKDDAAQLQEDMKMILALVAVIIFAVLLFTSGTYAEIGIFVVTFVVSAILNMGTNYWFGSVSFVTNAVGTVLQLAMSIDYAIILLHRFMEEHQKYDVIEAATVALSKAIPEISSSSLTTVSGMVALMLMQFQLGMDLGRVMSKAIIFSLITVFLLLPALIVFSAKAIEKTGHRSFVPKITWWGKLVVKTRYIVIPVYLVLVAASVFFSNQCHYIYDVNSIEAEKMNEFLSSKKKIKETFPISNTTAIIVPKGDYEKEKELIHDIEQLDVVDNVMGLANIEVDDDGTYILADSLSPREFSIVADQDINMSRMLYLLYARENSQYSAFMKSIDELRVPLIDMVDFIYAEKQSGGLTFGSDTSADIDELYDSVCDARAQLEGENYSRIIFDLEGPVEGEETFAAIDEIRDIIHKYYKKGYVVGDSTSDYDLSKSFVSDNLKISILTALFVAIILLFTFKSYALPLLLVLTIQSSIWLNFSVPYLTDSTMFFVSYLIVSAIQMGATIDYAIVITSRYMVLRETMESKKEAIIESLNQAFPTVITSGSIMVAAGFIIGKVTTDGTISSLGTTLGRGTLISIILVMTVLPQLLLMFDKVIEKSKFGKQKNDGKEAEEE
ncbi:MAG: efflux RND transporter permease subunit [Lachnospiraceae bacterium]